MEKSGVALVTLACVVFFRISVAEVEMRVRPGDNVTLNCDCVWEGVYYSVWFRNCSEKNHPAVLIGKEGFILGFSPHYSFRSNPHTRANNLLIYNVSKSDEGLYYCALSERKITDSATGRIKESYVYDVCNRSIQLSVLAEPSIGVCDVCVSEGSVNWMLMLSVCAVCVLLSSLLTSFCVYYLCKKNVEDKRSSERHEEAEVDDICYASLDIKKLEDKKGKKKKKKRVEQSDFSTYSEVRTERC